MASDRCSDDTLRWMLKRPHRVALWDARDLVTELLEWREGRSGWRPPARVIEAQSQLCLMPVGTVVRRTHPDHKHPQVFERQKAGHNGWMIADLVASMWDEVEIFQPGWTVTVLFEPEEGQ